ncbi:LysR substrate-binding domain-containing protein [Candidatus Aalborgicola defluviihabitans]|jgi:DNA-binding transcriptional LysR family regulator|uniref:LysR family transcriptional regulator n=1 Tax=Candidatus Aalborgicola defluviihabitans TaxID=3386187 RepID=UPI001DF63086|nr:LysR family transcriptional regulator [Burkholderiales bacterium]MBK6567604.1 LysR family transcriptional regulator [Burkholderiales bacterium]MBK7282355.1 LysR family transcriptional regulator [Burkholderiales bacterium]MBK7314102.1 LysR family transcriptional regulator [Burkholderiales bacterium]MBL0245245.1 LysR family transcriptional regulator [Rhodoferax sp.]
MNITLRQLRAFVALTQTGSFTDAAARLHVTQSALSGLIKELEQTLGVQVVNRSTRKVELAEVGREFYPLAARLLQDLDGALVTIADMKALKRGLVRIAAPQLMSASVLPEVIAGFKREYPDIEIRLLDCMVENVLPKVHSGEVDFAVGPERESSADIEAKTLFEIPFVVVFRADHPLNKKKRVTWDDALRYPVVALKGEFTHRLRVDLHESLHDEALNPANEVGFMTTAFAMVSAGLGVTTCLPYASNLIRLHQLQSRPLLEPEVRRKFLIFTRRDRPLSPAAQRFSEYLMDYVTAQPWCSKR